MSVIYLVGKTHATGCCNGNLSLPPPGGGRLGWGWFCGFR
ncbi:superoxide dismutase [Neisseria mucosa]|uniref:Superoxide dismutase n=1 Tax=Neisseria mucosa TaxID=488 RepID=A0ABM6T411_NEIMU|nr:superoxide dismutase [Neisseria mucosa]